MSKSVRSTKHTPLSQARIDRILANNPNTSAETLTTLKVVSESKPSIVLKSAENQVLDYNTLHPEAELKSFLDFLRNAESRYQAARQAYRENDFETARKLAVEASKLRHPRAQALIETLDGETVSADEKDISAIAHRRNDKDYKADRDSIRRR